MSLFGSSPDDSSLPSRSQPQSKSLFEDGPTPGTTSNASLFADEDDGSGPSPWALPTPKKAGRGELVKTLLPASAVPESYIDMFDTVLESGDRLGSGISLTGVKKIMEDSGLNAAEQTRVLNLVIPGGKEGAVGLGRSEFNVLLALIGLSQEDEEATLDGVDERRKNLPQPSLPYIKRIKIAKVSENLGASPAEQREAGAPQKPKPSASSTTRSRHIRRDSLENSEVDPWASPEMHVGHTHPINNEATPKSNGITAARPIANGHGGPGRTTSSFTTHPESPTNTSLSAPTPQDPPSGGGGEGWEASGGFPNADQSGLGPEGFGPADDRQRDPSGSAMSRSIGGGRTTSRGVEEVVTIKVLPEKEGMFMFQHRNYEVKSARRSSTVVRRYSDFVWLLDCLHKRYPFRQLPLLPPKRVAVNGRHLSSDVTFIEKRRRGLGRFTNALVRHPVLGQEQLVVMFLTVPTELAVWRKQATISVQEEFTGKPLPPGLEDSLPTNLADTFNTVRAGARRSADAYISLCNLLERLAKRNQGVAVDQLRFSLALTALTENSDSTYAIDTNDVPSLNAGIHATAKHLSNSQALLEDEARAWDEGVLEDFKRQRDTLVGIRDMFDRRDRFARDNIPQLERRIENNENKLAGLRGRPEGTVKPGEVEKVEQAIQSDKRSIVEQHARGVFIKECIRDELIYFQQSQYHVTKLHQDWSQERVKYAELQADNWRALSEEVENMPTGD